MEAGFAKVDITPPLEVLLGGHPYDKRAESVVSELYAKAMCLREDGQVVVIVSCDLLMVPTPTVSQIKGLIAQKIPIEPENILIAATHTHSGPMTAAILGVGIENDYLNNLPAKITQAACAAYRNLQPARLAATSTCVENLAFNRRFVMRDGTVQTHPLKNDPNILDSEGPADPELGIIYAVDPSDNFLGGIINFACHATVMARESTAISADYPGYATRKLEERLDPAATVLFLNGPCGNICQVDILNPDTTEVGAAWAEHMGERSAAAAAEAIRTDEFVPQQGIKVVTDTLSIPRRQVPAEVLTAARVKAEAADVPQSVRLSDYGAERISEIPDDKLSLADFAKTAFWQQMEAREVLSVQEQYQENPNMDVPITILSVGDFALVAVPSELFVEFGLEIKQCSPFKYTFISELTNGWVGYMPTEKAFSREGGYETKLMTTTPTAENAGQLLTERVIQLLS